MIEVSSSLGMLSKQCSLLVLAVILTLHHLTPHGYHQSQYTLGRARRHSSSTHWFPSSGPLALKLWAGSLIGTVSISLMRAVASPLGTGSDVHLSTSRSSIQMHSSTCSANAPSLSFPRTTLAPSISRWARTVAQTSSYLLRLLDWLQG